MWLRGLVLVIFAAAASASIFKTCGQSDFCSRLRYKNDGSGYCLAGDLGSGDDYSSYALKSSRGGKTLNFTLSFLNETYRVIINELDPSPRYHLDGILARTLLPKHVPVERVEEGNTYTFRFQDRAFYLEIQPCPFKLVLYRDGYYDPVAIFNAQDRFAMETEEPSVAIALDVEFVGAKRAYGIPEHADYLPLRSTTRAGRDPYRLYNLDVAFYQVESTVALYGAVPVLYAHGKNHTTGIFWHNAAETWVDVENKKNSVSAHFMSESGVMDFFILKGPKPEDVVLEYASLTGVAPLPQYFTLGYHQSRWNYMSQDDVKTVVAEFDNHRFPLDVIWLDIEYTDGKKYFTWDPATFSDPLEMQANLSATNRKLVTIIDPHIKKERGYFVYDQGIEHDLFVKNSSGGVFEGDCWPGLSSYLDFLNPRTQRYYANLYSFEQFNGTTENTYIWNDMNEPSVFDDSIEKTFPKDLVHYGHVKHRDVHNIYGFLQTKGTYQGLIDRSKGTKRPFILTRAHFAGSQRYSAVWTGDNTADWPHLAASFSMCLSQAIAGISFCGADIGGFFYDPPVELLQRWYQVGAWLPFYRAHANDQTERREPYLFPPDVEGRIRRALRQRYAHLPLWYTLFWEHFQTGRPVIRPLFYNYPNDMNVTDIDTQLIVGTSVMPVMVSRPDAVAVHVFFPGGWSEIWYDIDTFQPRRGLGYASVIVNLERIPVYYRGGSVIARKDIPRRSSVDTHGDPYSIYVFLNTRGEANGTLYVDDFESFDYERGKYLYLGFDFKDDIFKMRLKDERNHYETNAKIDEIVLVGSSKDVKSVTVSGSLLQSRQIPIQRGPNYVKATKLGLDLSQPFEVRWN